MSYSSDIERVCKLQSDLKSILGNLQDLSNQAMSDTSIQERDKVFKYMFELQESGVTNMLCADQYIQRQFGLPSKKAIEYLNQYFEDYTSLYELYGKPSESIPDPLDEVAAVPSTVKKVSPIVAWNAYKKKIRAQMESEPHEGKIHYNEVQKRAVESKSADPEAYIAFCNTLTI
jgi:hypothetical protein